MIKIMCCGDIHGRDYWKYFPKEDFDKIIFLGDYVDSFDKTDEEIYNNLIDIINYKKENIDKVILLLGNHCLQYYFSYAQNGCSGFRPKMYPSLHTLYNDNKDLFKPIHQIDNYLFSHAGITSVWLNKILKEIKGTPYENYKNLEELITNLFNSNNLSLYDVGGSRGGWCKSGGPFWADRSETIAYLLPNYYQVVGHTPVKEIHTHKWKQGNASINYCDDTHNYFEIEI